MEDLGLTKSGFLLPFTLAGNRVNFEASVAQIFYILVAGARHFLSQLVKNIEVVGETGRILGGINHHTAREMALLAAIRRQDG
jgi:hypothetical protein